LFAELFDFLLTGFISLSSSGEVVLLWKSSVFRTQMCFWNVCFSCWTVWCLCVILQNITVLL
jgi:hypothetical protein